MAKLRLARVDSRLLHASILLHWSRQVNANVVIVIDPVFARDPFYSTIIALSAPSDIRVRVLDEESVVAYWKNEEYEKERVILLAKKVETMHRLIRKGIPVDAVQLSQPPQNKRSRICSYYSEEEREWMHRLLDQNVRLYHQPRTEDDRIPIRKKMLDKE